ncbi:MAG TPA: flippase-like domain-containing protein [Candidatus Binatia bacterium]|nr:flippase-like domain-containing protein [Candidatus Binatia bacterium]
MGVIGLLVWLSDTPTLVRTAAAIDPIAFVLPVVLTVLSYAAMSRSYQQIADAAGCHIRFLAWLRITFVSNTVNYLVTTAGLSGFAVRMFLLSQRGVRSGRAVLISLVQTFLTNFTLLLFILIGFASLVLRHSLPVPALVVASLAVVVFAGVLTWAVVLMYNRRLRRRTLFFIADAAHRILRRVVPRWTPGRVRLWRFQHNLNDGLEFLLARKDRMLFPAAWIMLDWVLTIAILWAAFRAVNYPIPPGLVMVGFAVGICLSLISFVPGGLGVMEGSMTAVFTSLGVPFENAFLAVLIFRVAYYVLPLLTSFVLFHGVMLQAAHVVATRSRAPRFDTSLPPSI